MLDRIQFYIYSHANSILDIVGKKISILLLSMVLLI